VMIRLAISIASSMAIRFDDAIGFGRDFLSGCRARVHLFWQLSWATVQNRE
jgi:hypothetical protein